MLKRLFRMPKRKLLMVGMATLIAMTAFVSGVTVQDKLSPQADSTFQVGIGQKVITLGTTAYAAGTADYTCDGVADDVQFQAALNALPANGGKISVLTGNYVFSATVTRAIHNVTIEGNGLSTNYTYDGVNPIFTAGGNNWVFKNFLTDAGGINVGATTGWSQENVQLGSTYYAYRTSSDTTAISWNIPSGRSATYVVAASNAPAHVKAQADYVCDGTADDVEIQAAIDGLTSGRTWIETVKVVGNFTISATINLASYTRIDLNEAKINLASGANCHGLVNSDTIGGNTQIEIIGGIIDFNGANQTADMHGIRFEYVTNSKIIGCSLYNAYHHNLNMVGADNADIDVVEVYSASAGQGSTVLVPVNGADIIIQGKRIHALRCTVFRGSFHGIQVYSGAVDCTVTDCVAIEAANDSDDSSGHAFLSDAPGTIFTNCVSLDAKVWDGFRANAKECIFNGCRAIGSARYGFSVYDVPRCQVLNGIAKNSQGGTSAGVYIYGANATYNIVQNMLCCDDQDTPTQQYGIQTGDSADYNIIRNNVCYGNVSYGVRTVGSNNLVDKEVVSVVFDLSGSAAEDTLISVPCVAVVQQIEISYTEASSGDAGVGIKVGKYTSVADDDDYFLSVTSEVSKSRGYVKKYSFSSLSNATVGRNHTIYVSCAGGKTGTGEIKVTAHISYLGF